jgi:hypothetical protein
MAKKKVSARVKKSSTPKRIHMSSKKWAIGSVIVLAIAIPVTLSLVSQSQDIRQQASETRINGTVITTMPTDVLIIDISNEDGNTQQDNANGDGNNQNGKPTEEKTWILKDLKIARHKIRQSVVVEAPCGLS